MNKWIYKDRNYEGLWKIKKSDKNTVLLINIGVFKREKESFFTHHNEYKRIVTNDYFSKNFQKIKEVA